MTSTYATDEDDIAYRLEMQAIPLSKTYLFREDATSNKFPTDAAQWSEQETKKVNNVLKIVYSSRKHITSCTDPSPSTLLS